MIRGWVLFLGLLGLLGRTAWADGVGVNTHVPAPPVIDLVVEGGMKWIRLDNNWFSQEAPCSDSIGFIEPLDQAVEYAIGSGLCAFMTLAYTPPCASLGDADGRSQPRVQRDTASLLLLLPGLRPTPLQWCVRARPRRTR